MHDILVKTSADDNILFVLNNTIAITCQRYLTVLPETVVQVLNDQAYFHCASSSVSYAIYWEVDGIEARMAQILARGITFRTNGATTSTLTVESSVTNNNTEVVCIALNVENGETVQRSPIAYLFIQGKTLHLQYCLWLIFGEIIVYCKYRIISCTF